MIKEITPEDRRNMPYGGLPQEIAVNASGEGWRFRSPGVHVKGGDKIPFFGQGDITSSFTQLPHVIWRFARSGEHPVAFVSQCGALGVERSIDFYDGDVLSRLGQRDIEVMDKLQFERVLAYGFGIGALAAIALAAQHPERVAAVIAMNPAGLIRQDPLQMVQRVAKANLKVNLPGVKKGFVPPPTPSLSSQGLQEMVLRVMLGGTKDISVSDVGRDLLAQTKCPILVYSGEYDKVFPYGELEGLGGQFENVSVTEMVGFGHSDLKDRTEANRLVTHAKRSLRYLKVI